AAPGAGRASCTIAPRSCTGFFLPSACLSMPLGIACSKYQTRPWQMRDATAQQEDPMELQAPELFRQQAFIDGIWCDADQGRRTDSLHPADDGILVSVPELRVERTR